MADTGCYLFAVARDLPSGALSRAHGFDGQEVYVVPSGDLQAVVCRVDLEEFGEEALRKNLEVLPWVERVARTHDEVVRCVAESAEIAPMRLVTIYADEDGVRRQLEQVRDDLVAALDRVAGSAEWGVKAYARPVEAADEPAGREISGAAYLKRKRDQASARQAAEQSMEQVVQGLHQMLSGASVASRILPPQDPRLTGRAERMIHNGAYLVPHDEVDAFRGAATTLESMQPGLIIELQGPWPPYSFAVLEDG